MFFSLIFRSFNSQGLFVIWVKCAEFHIALVRNKEALKPDVMLE